MRQPGALRESRARTVTPILFHFGMLLRLEHRAQVVVSLPGRGLCGQRAVSVFLLRRTLEYVWRRPSVRTSGVVSVEPAERPCVRSLRLRDSRTATPGPTGRGDMQPVALRGMQCLFGHTCV